MLKHIKKYLFFLLICFVLLVFSPKPLKADLDNQLLEKIKQQTDFKHYYTIEVSPAFNKEELEKLKPQSVNLTLALGFNHYYNQNYQLALEQWQKVSKKHPKNAPINSLLGRVSLKNKNITEACKYFNKAIILQNSPLSETEKLSLTEDQLFLIYFCPLTFTEKQKTTKEIYKFRSDFLGPDDISTLIAALKLTDFLTDEKEIEEILQKIILFTENENNISSSLTTEALFKLTILYNQNERLDKLDKLANSEKKKNLLKQKKQKPVKNIYFWIALALKLDKQKEAHFIATLSLPNLIEMMQKKSQNQKQQLLKERYQFDNNNLKYNLKVLELKNKIKTIKIHNFIKQTNFIKQYNEIILQSKNNSVDLKNKNKEFYVNIYPYSKTSEANIFSFSSLLTKTNKQKIINFSTKQNKTKSENVNLKFTLKNIDKFDLRNKSENQVINTHIYPYLKTSEANIFSFSSLLTKTNKQKIINFSTKQNKTKSENVNLKFTLKNIDKFDLRNKSENQVINTHIYPYLKTSEANIFSFSSLLTKTNEQKKEQKALENINKLLIYLNMTDGNLNLELENKIYDSKNQ